MKPQPKKIIKQYVADNPLCTMSGIAIGTGIGISTVSTVLTRLREDGVVRRVEKDEQHRRARWEIGFDDNYEPLRQRDPDEPNRIIVREWPPCTVRDPLLWLSFGVAA